MKTRRTPYAPSGLRQHHQQWQHWPAGLGRLFSSSIVYGARQGPPVIHLTKCVAMELGEAGIRVNKHFARCDRHRIFRQGARSVGRGGREKPPMSCAKVYKTAQGRFRAPGLPEDIAHARGIYSPAGRIHLRQRPRSGGSMAPSPAAANWTAQQQGPCCSAQDVRAGQGVIAHTAGPNNRDSIAEKPAATCRGSRSSRS